MREIQRRPAAARATGLTRRAVAPLAAMLVAGSEARAQVQGYYESDGAFHLRQASEQSMDNLRAMQRIAQAQRQAYARVGSRRIAEGKASLRFSLDRSFSVTSHLIGLLNPQNPEDKALVPVIRSEAAPALQEFLALLASQRRQRDDFVDAITVAFVQNFIILSGPMPPPRFVTEQEAQLRAALMKDPVFQGTSDLEKQQHIEAVGAQTVYAMRSRAAGQSGDAAAGVRANQVARSILAAMLARAPDAAVLNAIARGEPLPALPNRTPSAGAQVAGTNGVSAPSGNNGAVNATDTPIGSAIPGAKDSYTYNTDLAVARNVAIEHSDTFSPQRAQELLDAFYAEVARRGGQRNNLADVGALMAFTAYYVVSDGVELTPRQYASTRALVRKLVLESETIQQLQVTDLQYRTEREVIFAANNYANFRRDRAVLSRRYVTETERLAHFGAADLIASERKIALNVLDLVLGNFKTYRLTPDGFTR